MTNLKHLIQETSEMRPSSSSRKIDHVRSYDPINISINVDDNKGTGGPASGTPATTTTPLKQVPPPPPLPSVAIPSGTPDILTVNERKFQPLSTQDVQQLQNLSTVPPPTYKTVSLQESGPKVNYAAVAASFRSKAAKTKLYVGLGIGLVVLVVIVVVVIVLIKKKHSSNSSKSSGPRSGGFKESLDSNHETSKKKKKKRYI